MNSIFRKSSLEKLSSPEQLDKTIAITSPMSWMAIIGIALIVIAFCVWAVMGSLPTTVNVNGIMVNGSGVISVYSEYNGELTQNLMKQGEQIHKGEVLGRVKETGGEDKEIIASQEGTITAVIRNVGDSIGKYDVIARINPLNKDEDVVIAYLPADSGKLIQTGMKAIVTPISLDGQKYGHMEGEVISVDDYITSEEDIRAVIGNNSIVNELFTSDMPMSAVVIGLKEDSESESGYYWTSERGKTLDVTAGTITNIQIITSESAPIAKLLPIFDTEG